MSSYSDNFNRSDGGLGSNWVVLRGSFAIVSNQVKGSGVAPAITHVATSAATFSADQTANLTLQSKSTFDFIGPAVRINPSTKECYFVRTDGRNNSSNRVYRFDGTSSSVCSGSTINLSGSDGDVFTLSAVGTTISVYRNGSLVESFTDSAYTTGQPGIAYWADYSSATRGDDFSAEDIGGLTPAAIDTYRRLCGIA